MVRPSTYETFLPPESPYKEPVPPLSLREKATAVAVNLRLRANAAAVAWQSASCEPTMELRGRKVPRSRSPSRSSPTSRSPPNETRGKIGFATTLAGVGVLLLAYAILPSAKRLPTAADQCNPNLPDHCHMRVRSLSEADDIAALEAAATWHQASASAAEARLASAEAALTWHQAAAEAAESQLASTKEEAARLERLLQYTSGRLAEERQQTQRRQRDEAEACEARVAARGEECAAIVAASETALAQGEARWAQGEALRAEQAARWAAERSELIAAAEAAAEESLARCEAAAQVGNVARPNPTTSRRALRALLPKPRSSRLRPTLLTPPPSPAPGAQGGRRGAGSAAGRRGGAGKQRGSAPYPADRRERRVPASEHRGG